MIGKRIKQLREQHGFTITELADQAGISKSYLSYIERGIQTNPSLHVLSKIAKTLHIHVDELVVKKQDIGTSKNDQLDKAWISLVNEAIDNGVTKEEFAYYINFIRYTKKRQKL